MLHRLDRYVLGSFLRHWVIVGAAFVLLFTVLDLVGHSDEIGESKKVYGAVGVNVFRYYLLNAPFFLVQFAPYVTLLAAISTVMQLRRSFEWTPQLTAGRSAWRAFLPMLITSVIIGHFLAELRECGFPRLQLERAQLQAQLFEQEEWRPQELWLRGPRDQRVQIDIFEPSGFNDASLPRVIGLEVFSLGPRGEDVSIYAREAIWDGSGWELIDGRRTLAGNRASESSLSYLEMEGFRPHDLVRAWVGQNQPLELTRRDAGELLARDSGHRQAATLRWSLSVAPWVHLVLLLIGLPYVLNFERQSSLEGVAVGLLLCALFFVVDFLFQDLGQRGVLTPWLAGIAPVVIFGSLGLLGQGRLAT
ncbi:MAG: LptF/LptG family permease [Planctomycetes bacterium]|nr:LptF/LptG family permease [Planctomycetota bacterium]